jgi:hypothetical protein
VVAVYPPSTIGPWYAWRSSAMHVAVLRIVESYSVKPTTRGFSDRVWPTTCSSDGSSCWKSSVAGG